MSKKQPAKQPKPKKPDTSWPWLFRVNPKVLVWSIVGWIVFAWLLFLAVDIWQIIKLGNERPMWSLLFNDRPVEWTQWFLFAFAITMSGYLAARLDVAQRRMAAKFFLLFAIGLGLMMIEDAGDIRHTLSWEIQRIVGDTIFGLPYRSMVDLPYFALLATVPLYTVIRYGRYIWPEVAVRRYFVASVILYAIASIGSGARYFGDFYQRTGAWIDNNLMGGRFPMKENDSQETTHLLLIDSPIEESIETIAITLLIAGIITYALRFRTGQLLPEKPPKKYIHKSKPKA